MEKLIAFRIVLVVAFFVGSVLVACAPRPAATPAPRAPQPAQAPAPLRELEISVSRGSITQVHFELIKERGIDRKYGLDLKKLPDMPVGELQAAVAQGRVPIASTGTGTLAKHFIDGRDIKALNPAAGPLSALVSWKGSGIKTVQQAKGMKIVVPSRPTGGYWEQAAIFKMEGLDLEKDFHMIESVDTPLMAGLLEKKEVALAQIWEPMTSKLRVKDAIEVLWYFKDKEKELFGSPTAIAGDSARGEWVRANPEIAKAYIKIYREVKALLLQNPGLVDPKAHLMGLTDPEEIRLTKQILVNEDYLLRDWAPLQNVMDKWLKTVYELGLLEKQVKLDDIIFKIPLD